MPSKTTDDDKNRLSPKTTVGSGRHKNGNKECWFFSGPGSLAIPCAFLSDKVAVVDSSLERVIHTSDGHRATLAFTLVLSERTNPLRLADTMVVCIEEVLLNGHRSLIASDAVDVLISRFFRDREHGYVQIVINVNDTHIEH